MLSKNQYNYKHGIILGGLSGSYIITMVPLLLLWYQTNPLITIETGLLVSATITFSLATLNLPKRLLVYQSVICGIFHMFILLTYWYITTDNILVFFLIYELFLLPSSYLVYKISPNKRAVKSTNYFVLWTQAGSMLVFGGIILMLVKCKSVYFSQITSVGFLPGILILVGFCVKIPVFPFFFWLTKTHVEAVTSFSIFLSGFLVKLAVFGLVKFQPATSAWSNNAVLPAALLSITIGSASFIYQTDYKKVIAYATIQEMNVLLVLLLVTVRYDQIITAHLLVVHTLLSGLFFSIADALYKKYSTRSIASIRALFSLSPKLATLLLIGLVLFKGLPYTAKFPIEYSLYTTLIHKNVILGVYMATILVFLGNLLFSIVNIRALFGVSHSKTVVDLNTKELLVVAAPLGWLVWLAV